MSVSATALAQRIPPPSSASSPRKSPVPGVLEDGIGVDVYFVLTSIRAWPSLTM